MMTAYQTLPIKLTLLGAMLFLAACSDDPTVGYTGKSLYPQDVHTVAIPIWKRGKDVYRRDLEMRITEALVKRVEAQTPYKVVNKDKADTVLTGTIDLIEQATLSFNPDTGEPREMELAIVVTFEWKDQRTGKTRRSYPSFRVANVYLPTPPYNEDFFQGSQDVIDRLAERVVEKMQVDDF